MLTEYFNSTIVRLKGWIEIASRVPDLHFNSTIVRLKVDKLKVRYIKDRFQFNYCTIKSFTKNLRST